MGLAVAVAACSILGRKLTSGQQALMAKLQMNTYELLFAYMYSSVILAVLSLSFALGELSLNDTLLGVAGLFLFCVLLIGTMLAVRASSLQVVLNHSFQLYVPLSPPLLRCSLLAARCSLLAARCSLLCVELDSTLGLVWVLCSLNLLFLLFGYAIIFLAGWAYKKNILSQYTSNSNAWFATSIVIGVSTVLISFWGIMASRRRARKWLLSYAIVLSLLLAGVLAAAVGVYTNDSLVDDAVNSNCAK
jgi:hypothetical protein